MAIYNYVLNLNDITKTNLVLNFDVFNRVSDNVSVISPGITELGSGFYKFSFDIESVSDDVYYVVSDGGANVLTDVISQFNANIIDQNQKRLLGLNKENQYIDSMIYDINNNLTSARLRTYSVAASVGTDDDVLATYNITSNYAGNNINDFTAIKA